MQRGLREDTRSLMWRYRLNKLIMLVAAVLDA